MHDALKMDQDSGVLDRDQDYPVYSLEEPSVQAVMTCTGVIQRNWSRVGDGVMAADRDGNRERVFIKQNVDRGGLRHSNHWSYEKTGTVIARDLLQDVITVPALRYRNEALLINVFSHIDVIPIDELLRTDTAAFERTFTGVMARMVRVLECLRAPPEAWYTEVLPLKTRPYGGSAMAVNFKGFEIRNTGLARKTGGVVDPDNVVMFDFVRPYLGPVEEAAAKLFVSIGLLNWGKPLGRFVQGPDLLLLEQSAAILRPYLDRQAVAAEIELQHSFRTREFQGSGRLERSFKRAGINVIGKRYLDRLARWCERYFG